MDPLSFDRKPRIPNEVLEEWPTPSGVQRRVWGEMSLERRSEWLVSRYYHEVDGQWIPKPETSGSVETRQIAQCETTVAGAGLAVESLVRGIKESAVDTLAQSGAEDQGGEFGFWGEGGFPLSFVLFVVAVVVSVMVGLALVADLFGGGDATDEAVEQGVGTTLSIAEATSTSLAATGEEPSNSTEATTSTQNPDTTTTSTSSTTTTTEASSTITVDVAAASLHREAGIVVNMLGNNLTAEAQNRGVVGNWASTTRTDPGTASGSVVVDADAKKATFDVVEAWSCVDACRDIWDYQELSISLKGSLDMVPSGSTWTLSGPITIEYRAQCGRPETASDCGGTECYICGDQYCTWDLGLSRQATLSGSIDGDLFSVAVDEGLAEDISTMDFSSLLDTEFFMSRYVYQAQLPEPVPVP